MRCPKCGSRNIYATLVYFNDPQMDNKKMCQDCGHEWGNKPSGWDNYTVFHQITASPEVLAEKFVYKAGQKLTKKSKYYDGWNVSEISTQDIWKSTITHESYKTEAEAIAATLARLKEVCDENG